MSWSKEKVSSFAEVATGGTPSTDKREFWEGGTIPWLNSGDLNQGIITKALTFITEEGYKSSSTRMMPVDCVLIALTGATTGLTALLKIEACANQSVTGILPSKKHHPEFLYYFFRTQREKILRAAWGGAQPHINQKYVKDYVVPLPEIIDQIKIATVLSKAEALIKQRKESIELLDVFLKNTFFKMFGDPVRNEKGWKKKTLEELVPENCPLTYGIVQPGEEFPNGVPVVRPVDLTKEYVTLKGLKLIDPKISKQFKRTILNGDEMLMCVRGTTGVLSFATSELKGCNVTRGITPIWFSENVSKLFAYHLLKSVPIQNEIARKTYGIALKQINLSDLRKLELINPPISTQLEFQNIAEKVSQLKEQFKKSLTDLVNLYGSLSQKAFKEELNLSGIVIGHIIPISKGGSDSLENLQAISEKENIVKANKLPISLEALHREFRQLAFREAFKVLRNRDDAEDVTSDLLLKLYEHLQKHPVKYLPPYIAAAAKYAALSFRNKRKLDTLPLEFFPADFDFPEATDESEKFKKGEILWEKVSIQQVSNWITQKYAGHHFSSEMLLRFLQEEQLTQPYYFSSEELKKFPKFNSLDDLHTLIFSSLNGENPYLKLKQIFYNATAKTFSLNLSKEDIEITSGRNDELMTGIYFYIL